MSDFIDKLIAEEGLPASYRDIVDEHWRPLATRIAREAASRTPLIVGISAAQGTGKSTLCKVLEGLLAARGLRTVTLALDDLYLPREQRQALAREVHPLFATRGVPGTHAVAEGIAIIEDILAGRAFDLPRFDKASDDRLPETERITGPVHVLLFEGWCVGAKPQDAAALAEPVNGLEAEEDPDGIWRGLANHWLAEDYARLFGLIDLLVMLRVADFDAVRANRAAQEAKLVAARPDGAAVMDDAALARFLMHYERLTKHMLSEMPERADIVYDIDASQRPGLSKS